MPIKARSLAPLMCLIMIMGSHPALAQTSTSPAPSSPNPPTLSTAEKDKISGATAYLESLSGAQGRFVQTDAKGKVTSGAFWLKKPGKIRFAYDAPFSQIVVSDGKNVSVYDPRLQSIDRYPLGLTPLSLFLSRQIRLDKGVEITEFVTTKEGFLITAKDKKREAEGSITLAFRQAANGALTLMQWTVTDGQNRRTTVHIQEMSPTDRLDPKLFSLDSLPKAARTAQD